VLLGTLEGALDIRAGTKVVLKSGGPTMTVAWAENGEAYCEWFLEKGELKGAKFNLTSLKTVPDDI
jgi:uncharacterized protein YodC (DUF2158 family)